MAEGQASYLGINTERTNTAHRFCLKSARFQNLGENTMGYGQNGKLFLYLKVS